MVKVKSWSHGLSSIISRFYHKLALHLKISCQGKGGLFLFSFFLFQIKKNNLTNIFLFFQWNVPGTPIISLWFFYFLSCIHIFWKYEYSVLLFVLKTSIFCIGAHPSMRHLCGFSISKTFSRKANHYLFQFSLCPQLLHHREFNILVLISTAPHSSENFLLSQHSLTRSALPSSPSKQTILSNSLLLITLLKWGRKYGKQSTIIFRHQVRWPVLILERNLIEVKQTNFLRKIHHLSTAGARGPEEERDFHC